MLRHALERRHVHAARHAAPARAGRGAQCHRGLLRCAHQCQARVRGRSRHRHLLRRADGLGVRDPLPGRPRPGGDGRHAHRADRSVADGQPGRRQGRLRPDLAAGRRLAPGNAGAGAAAVRGQALSVDRGRARRWAEILRGADGRGRQPRRPRDRTRARSAARKGHARPRHRRTVSDQKLNDLSGDAHDRAT